MPTRLWIAAYSLVLGGASLALVGYAKADKDSIVAKEDERVLFDATLAASGLDATLRVASLGMAHLASGAGSFDAAAERLAFNLPEASNIYRVGEDGRVMWTAYRRTSPSIRLSPTALERLAAGSAVECRLADAPLEGGTVLALARRVEAGGFAAALFNAASLSRSVAALLEGRDSSVSIADADGVALMLAGPATPSAASAGGPWLAAETVYLASVPVSVTVSSDLSGEYRAWVERTVLLTALTAGFALAVGAMIALGAQLYRRRERLQELRKDIEGKELLYREVNHRVKNNLAIVQTVLELGSDEVAEHPGRALPALRSSVDRVRAVGLLHELLYRRGAEGQEDLGAYLAELADSLSSAYGLGGRVKMIERHEADIRAGLDRLVPLALIVNELVANACKYAFPGGSGGAIRIVSYRPPEGGFRVEVRDDGVGMPSTNKREGGIGTMLIEALAAQVDAKVERIDAGGRGVAWRVEVPPGA